MLSRAVALGIGLLALVGASGCAFHYRNPRTGAEQLWGFGQLRLNVQPAGAPGQLAVVTSGCRVPGLCLDVGRDHYGIALGYVDRQQAVVISSNQISTLEFPTNSIVGLFPRAANSRWMFGQLRVRATGQAQSAHAIITGRALAGLGAGFGGGDTSLSVALDTRQQAAIADADLWLEFDQDASQWPGFDFFTAALRADSAAAPSPAQPTGEP
jgi:hypothetical protein